MTEPTVDDDQFNDWVADALHRLHDAAALQAHPLAALLAEPDAGPAERGRRLRQHVYRAIHALHPGGSTASASPDWRTYRLLELRFVEALSVQEAMQQLGLGKSQFYHKQSEAIRALAAKLRELAPPAHNANATAQADAPSPHDQVVVAETERLFNQAVWGALDVADVVEQMRPMFAALSRVQQTAIDLPPLQSLAIEHGDRVIGRQAVLNVVMYALKRLPKQRLHIQSFTTATSSGLEIRGEESAATEPQAPLRDIGIEISRRLLQAMYGELTLHEQPASSWHATLAWSRVQVQTLLVVDDNAGIIELFRRYLVGQPWQVVGATDGASARQLLAEHVPTVIILDVMMPHEDGWEVLAALRADARTASTPIFVCSVLAEPQLAVALGATAYLPKPITQPALLQTLKPWFPSVANSRSTHPNSL